MGAITAGYKVTTKEVRGLSTHGVVMDIDKVRIKRARGDEMK
jgi:hypothetical protein